MGWPVRNGAVQAILPATLPTPTQARSNLKLARSEVREKGNVADGMKDRLAAAKEEQVAALLEVEEAENEIFDAPEESPEDIAANARHQKMCKRAARAASDVEKVSGTLKLARGELRVARKHLAAARQDLEAIRDGRKARR
jgi:hypothetical protein